LENQQQGFNFIWGTYGDSVSDSVILAGGIIEAGWQIDKEIDK
jgi:hypothetical protein